MFRYSSGAITQVHRSSGAGRVRLSRCEKRSPVLPTLKMWYHQANDVSRTCVRYPGQGGQSPAKQRSVS